MDGVNGYGNRNTVAIEICRNYDRSRKTTKLNEPLQSQYTKAEQNTIKYVAKLCIDLGIVANNSNIKTHNDWNGKWCPSKILNEGRLQSVKNAIIAEYNRLKGNNAKPSTPSKPASKPSNNGLYGAKLVKNEKAKFTVTTPNGIKVRNAPSVKAKHVTSLKKGASIHYTAVYEGNGYRWLRYAKGKDTLYVPYRSSSNIKDQWGTFGSATVAAKPAPVKKIKEDGWLGKETATAWQKHHKITADGIISGQPKNASTRNVPSVKYGTTGSNLVRAVQRDLGTPVDGKISEVSMMVKALQRKLGTPVDGKISGPSLMVKELQKRLNNGTL